MRIKSWWMRVRGKIESRVLVFLCVTMLVGFGFMAAQAVLDVNDSSASTVITTIPTGESSAQPSLTTGRGYCKTREVDFSDTDYAATVASTVTLFTIPAYTLVKNIVVDVKTAEINASYNPTITVCMDDTAVTSAIDAETTATVVALNVGGTYAFPGKAYRTEQDCELDVLVGGLDNAKIQVTVYCEPLPYDD